MIKNEICVIYLRESCHAQWNEGLECQTQKLFDYCRKNYFVWYNIDITKETIISRSNILCQSKTLEIELDF